MSLQVQKTITINSSPKTVWAMMTDIDNWSNWQTDISKAKLNVELKPNSTLIGKLAEPKFIQRFARSNPIHNSVGREKNLEFLQFTIGHFKT